MTFPRFVLCRGHRTWRECSGRRHARAGGDAFVPRPDPGSGGGARLQGAAVDLTQDTQRQAAIAVEAPLDKAARGEGTPAPESPETRPALGK